MTIIAGLDLETTGNDTEVDRICEIAIVLQDWETGDTKLNYVRRVNPEMHIAAKALAVHGISDADVMGCATFAQIARPVKMILERVDLLVWHNGENFDQVVLARELIRCGITEVDMPPSFDTMLAARGATPDGKFPTLGELCWAMDIEYDPDKAHAALYDVEVMLAAYRNGVRYGQWPAHPLRVRPAVSNAA